MNLATLVDVGKGTDSWAVRRQRCFTEVNAILSHLEVLNVILIQGDYCESIFRSSSL
jgi:hypothetical protein